MHTYLGETEIMGDSLAVTRVLNIEASIGKQITTGDDFLVSGLTKDGTIKKMNIKEQVIRIDDVIRTCGLHLYCSSPNKFQFAISPESLIQFKEI